MSQKRTHYKGYLSRSEAMARLGVGREMLESFVRNGRLERIVPPGRKQGYYRAEEVDALARELKEFEER
jgi:predicted site-specific integrase-resolvase